METKVGAANVSDQARADAPSKCAACGGENFPGACCCYRCFTSGNVSCGPPPGDAAEDVQEMTQPVIFAPAPALIVNKTGSAGSLAVLAEAAACCFTRDVQETVRQMPERPPHAGTTLLRPQPSVYVAPSRTAEAAQGLAKADNTETAARPTVCCRLPCNPESQPAMEHFVPVQEPSGCCPQIHLEASQPAGNALAASFQPDGSRLPADLPMWGSHDPCWAPYLMGMVAAAQLGAQAFQPLGQSQSCPPFLSREQIQAGLMSAALGLAASASQPISEPARSFPSLHKVSREQFLTQPHDAHSLPVERGSQAAQAAQQGRDGYAADMAWGNPTSRWASLCSEPATQPASAFKTLNPKPYAQRCDPQPSAARASGEILTPAQCCGGLQPTTPVSGNINIVLSDQRKASACCLPLNTVRSGGAGAETACQWGPGSCCQPRNESAEACGRTEQVGQSGLARSPVIKPERARLHQETLNPIGFARSPHLLPMKRSQGAFREGLAGDKGMQEAGCSGRTQNPTGQTLNPQPYRQEDGPNPFRQEGRQKDDRANSAESSETTCGPGSSSQPQQPGEGAEQGNRGTKTCTRCHKALPAASFCKNRRSPDGLFTQCRACVAIKDKARHAKILAQPKAPAGCKVCSRCRERKGQGEFYLDAGRPDGLQTYCKLCYAEKYREKKRLKAMLKGM